MKITIKKELIKSKLSLLFFILCISLFIYAQKPSKSVEGFVIDKAGEPLIGATVIEVSTKNGTVTNIDGKYKLDIIGNASVLKFSFLGYKEVEIPVEGKLVINVTLEETSYTLNEVVSIGYATARRRDLTSAVSSVSGSDLIDIPSSSVTQALTGKLSGVQVTTSEGDFEADLKVRVRGGTSITQDNSPIYIIDGVNVEEGLAGLSVQDIASIDVLKDAASTSIYGARGANGVIIVTTKQAKEGKPKITYSPSFGFSKVVRNYDVMNTYEYLKYHDERSRISVPLRNAFLADYGSDMSVYEGAESIDWQDKLFGRTAFQHRHDITISGGNPNSKYNIGYNRHDQQGVMERSKFNKDIFNATLSQMVNKKLSLTETVRYIKTKREGAGVSNTSSSTYNLLRNIINYKPFLKETEQIDEFDEDFFNESGGSSLSAINPIALNNGQTRIDETDNIRLTGILTYKISNSLTFRSVLGVGYGNLSFNTFNDYYTPIGRYLGDNSPHVALNKVKNESMNNTNTLTYTKRFKKSHSFTALLGQESYRSKSELDKMSLKQFPVGITYDKAFGQLNLGTPLLSFPQNNISESSLLSYFTRINYSYKGIYILTGTYRMDGSSKFHPDYRWRGFPSASAAWRVSSEPFMKGVKFIEDLKIRASYGSAGNNRIGNHLYMPTFMLGSSSYRSGSFYNLNQNFVNGYAMTDLPNKFVKWEKTNSLNVGFDVTLFNYYTITLDAYNNVTQDLLIDVPIPVSAGYTKQIQNVGKTQNKGIELELSGPLVKTKDFSWSMDFNISFNKNKVLQLSHLQDHMMISSGVFGTRYDYILKKGSPVGLMYGYVNDGFYKLEDFDYNSADSIYTLKPGVPNATGIMGVIEPGTKKLLDLNKDSIIDDRDQKVIGNANPKFFGGFTQNFKYKNFDLSIFVNFVYGNSIYNLSKLEFTNSYSPYSNMLSIMNDRWRTVDENGRWLQYVQGTRVKGDSPEVIGELNKDAKIWKPPLTTATSFMLDSWGIEDGSFIRLNNITMGYTFTDRFCKTLKINSLRAHATLNNLYVWTKYTGFDPEVNTRSSNPLTQGIDYSAYPRSISAVFGLNITF